VTGGLPDRRSGWVSRGRREELGQAAAIDANLPLVHAFQGPVREPSTIIDPPSRTRSINRSDIVRSFSAGVWAATVRIRSSACRCWAVSRLVGSAFNAWLIAAA